MPRPPKPPRVLTTKALARLLGLGPYWERQLEVELGPTGARVAAGRWDLDVVRDWKLRLIAEVALLEAYHLRAVALRAYPFPALTVESRGGHSASNAQLDHWGLALALAYTHDHAPMRPGRAGDRLRRHGYPPPTALSGQVSSRATRMWLDGAPRDLIRSELQMTTAALERFVAQAQPRLTTGDITARFGWSADLIHQMLLRAKFPDADGKDGNARWWWEQTVTRWERTANLVTCPQCGARVRRLSAHQRAHKAAQASARRAS